MKNKITNIKSCTSLALFGAVMLMLHFASCKKEESSYSGPITISKVYLQDAESDVTDREVTFARIGQLMRIEGTGFTDLKRVYINGYSSYFNPVMVSDNSMLIKIDKATPIVEADPTVRNTIKMANDGNSASIEFSIRAAAPTITEFSHTLPQAGEQITVYGTGLLEVNKVVFPGAITVTEGIISDEEGEFFSLTVPEGISEDGGSIFIECANGGAYSPACFNFKNGVIMDFDGLGQHGYWGSATSMINPEDLESASIGEGTVSQGTYAAHRPARIDTVFANKVRNSEVWTAGNDVDDWRGQLTPFIPAETPVSDVAFQFDMYTPDTWQGTAYLKVCLVNGFNGGEWAGQSYNYVPWVVGGESVPIETTGWVTVTVPFSSFYAFSDGDYTFEDVLVARETSSYKNFGFYLENSDFNLSNITGNEADSETEFISSNTQIKVYTDNWRVVSINTPVYSDFPEEEVE